MHNGVVPLHQIALDVVEGDGLLGAAFLARLEVEGVRRVPVRVLGHPVKQVVACEKVGGWVGG